MKCIRCSREITESTCDYVIADDFIVKEKRERFYAVNNKDEFIPIKQTSDSLLIPDVKRIEVKIEESDIQKTGLVCSDCYKNTDTIIWGVHKI